MVTHATGAVTSAYSVHVIFEEYATAGTGTGGGLGAGGGKHIDLVLVDHSANDISLRTSYVSEEVIEEVMHMQQEDPKQWWAAERVSARASHAAALQRANDVATKVQGECCTALPRWRSPHRFSLVLLFPRFSSFPSPSFRAS